MLVPLPLDCSHSASTRAQPFRLERHSARNSQRVRSSFRNDDYDIDMTEEEHRIACERSLSVPCCVQHAVLCNV